MPENTFSLVDEARSYLFIIGGIGITPILSMIRLFDELLPVAAAVARTQPLVVQPAMVRVSMPRASRRGIKSVPKKHEAYFLTGKESLVPNCRRSSICTPWLPVTSVTAPLLYQRPDAPVFLPRLAIRHR